MQSTLSLALLVTLFAAVHAQSAGNVSFTGSSGKCVTTPATFDLSNYYNQQAMRVTDLSGGQQQRVALARAVAVRPSVLLLDEPLSNLDAELRYAMREQLADLQQRLGCTAIYVTHDQEEAFALAHRVAILKDGECHQIGTPSAILQSPATPFVAAFVERLQDRRNARAT